MIPLIQIFSLSHPQSYCSYLIIITITYRSSLEAAGVNSLASVPCTVMDELEVSTGEGEVCDSPAAKKVWYRKFAGSAKYSTSYQKAWEDTCHFVSKSRQDILRKVCNKDVSIKHQVALDIQQHSEGKTHQERVVAMPD